MWSITEIFQFIFINIVALFMISFSIINLFGKAKKLKYAYSIICTANVIWLILIYLFTFVLWKTSWGVNFGLNTFFFIINLLIFIAFNFLDKNNKFSFLKTEKKE
ncbi:hypothetical protein SMONO_v1c04360 [Spiroplasma monobiae MQ-1]|uniref:Uncharacterized protein n=1 Tax=Spiroplasma monobiae MQ-1 TaxID=1336748 RepID=A0A2K9LWB8_SPISQ|nr:hypothetical protein SMONO_v1c04360 [Spiroplasma monobiae MQ-1]